MIYRSMVIMLSYRHVSFTGTLFTMHIIKCIVSIEPHVYIRDTYFNDLLIHFNNIINIINIK